MSSKTKVTDEKKRKIETGDAKVTDCLMLFIFSLVDCLMLFILSFVDCLMLFIYLSLIV